MALAMPVVRRHVVGALGPGRHLDVGTVVLVVEDEIPALGVGSAVERPADVVSRRIGRELAVVAEFHGHGLPRLRRQPKRSARSLQRSSVFAATALYLAR
jgi:hypothetical protein